MDENIVSFIEKQTCANICGVDEAGNPYCFTCFYSFDKTRKELYFKSSASLTRHGKILSDNEKCAGTLVEDTLDLLLIKGVQFQGKVRKNNLFDLTAAMHYHARHPVAMGFPGDMWTVELTYVKFTDNSKGFGTKFEWRREAEE